MKITLSTLGLFFMIMGCAKQATSHSEAKAPETTPVVVNKRLEEPNSDFKCQLTDPEKPFSCLEQKCLRAKGKYDSITQHCDCGEEYAFNGWNDGKCESFEMFLDEDSKKVASVSLKGKDVSVYQMMLSDFSAKENKLIVGNFYRGIQALMQIGTLPQQSYINLLYGPGSLAQLSPSKMHKLRMEPNVKLRGSHDSDSLDKYYYLFTADEPSKLFKPATGRVLIENLDSNRLSEIEKTTYSFLTAMSQYQRSNEIVTLYTADGCSSHCELREVGTKNGIYYERARRILGGQFYSDTLELYSNSKSQAFARVELFPNGQVSMIHLFDRRVHQDLPVTLWTIYDRNFTKIYQNRHEHKVLADMKAWQRVLNSVYPSLDERPEVVVCESGFSLETVASLSPSTIVKGPYVASKMEESQSLFGWVNSENVSPLKEQWIDGLRTSGVSSLGIYGLPSFGERLDEHAKSVAAIASGKDHSVGIIPIGLDECFYQTDKWIGTVRSHSQARVVNLSAYESKESIACEKSVLAKQIKKSENVFLFVAAAGNAGLNDEEEKLGICPQALAGRKNLVVVASSVNESIMPISNRGRSFVDLAADASHYDHHKPQTYATSYAAPKVSNVAAILNYKFPLLSPAQLRLSLLLGAKIPYSYRYGYQPLAVRAGGVLNRVDAEKVAQELSNNPGISTERLLNQVYCDSESQKCEEATLHLQLAKNGKFTLEGVKQ